MVGLPDRFGGGLREDRGDHRVDGLGVGRSEVLGDVAGEVDPAALPPSTGQDGLDRGFQAAVGVADDQRHPLGVRARARAQAPLT